MEIINLFNKRLADLNPIILGTEKCAPGHNNLALREYCLIHYVKKGCGYIEKNGEKIHIDSGNMFIIPAGEYAFYKADNKTPWEYIWIGFNGKLSSKFKELGITASGCGDIFEEMLRCREMSSCREEYLAAKLFELYAKLFDGKTKISNYVKTVKDIVKASYQSNLSVGEIASSIGLERTYLSKIFKISTGQSIRDYIIEIRMTKAVSLLKEGYSVGDTAKLVGYTDSFNFSRIFKIKMGIPPIAVKKRN